VGFLLQMASVDDCCGNAPPSLNVVECSLAGVMVALIVLFFTIGFAGTVSKLSVWPVVLLALIIAVIVGVVLGPIGYHLPVPGLALFVCGLLGALLGWLVCRILCRDAKWVMP
jgi:hypothetical protein